MRGNQKTKIIALRNPIRINIFLVKPTFIHMHKYLSIKIYIESWKARTNNVGQFIQIGAQTFTCQVVTLNCLKDSFIGPNKALQIQRR